MASQQKRAADFRRLHQGPKIFLLANCWDAGSARLTESLGARALATTSAGVAWALGYPDGDKLPLDLLVSAVESITRVVNLPLTVDMESGFGKTPKSVGAAVARVIGAGAIGMNIEDGSGSPNLLCHKIEEVKKSAKRRRVDFFVNARTDVYLRGLAPESRRVEETLARASRYREAGADGLFVPGLTDPAAIRTIASEAGLPLNLLAWQGLAPATELEKLGVRRLSAGSGIAESAWGRAAKLARDFLREGESDPLSADAMEYGAINALVKGR